MDVRFRHFTTAPKLGVEEMIASIEMAQLTKGTVDALKTGVARDHETLADAVCQIDLWTADFRDIWVHELYMSCRIHILFISFLDF